MHAKWSVAPLCIGFYNKKSTSKPQITTCWPECLKRSQPRDLSQDLTQGSSAQWSRLIALSPGISTKRSHPRFLSQGISAKGFHGMHPKCLPNWCIEKKSCLRSRAGIIAGTTKDQLLTTKKYMVPSTKHLVPSTEMYQVRCTKYSTLGTKYAYWKFNSIVCQCEKGCGLTGLHSIGRSHTRILGCSKY